MCGGWPGRNAIAGFCHSRQAEIDPELPLAKVSHRPGAGAHRQYAEASIHFLLTIHERIRYCAGL